MGFSVSLPSPPPPPLTQLARARIAVCYCSTVKHRFPNLHGIRKLVRKIGEIEESGAKLQCLTGKREKTFGSSYREVHENEGSKKLEIHYATSIYLRNISIGKQRTTGIITNFVHLTNTLLRSGLVWIVHFLRLGEWLQAQASRAMKHFPLAGTVIIKYVRQYLLCRQ